jgi:replicative DNA helicase
MLRTDFVITGPSYSEECERGVLGCCLLEPELLDEVASQLASGDFYDLRHANTLELMQDMRRQSLPIDTISIREEAKSLNGGIQALGGIAYLAQHLDIIPSAAQLPYYVSVVKRKAKRRQLNEVAHQILSDARGDDDAVLEDHFALLNGLLCSDTTGGEVSIRAAIQQAVAEIESAHELGGKCTGLSTGFPSLDFVTGGLQRGDMIVLAGRPSMGKTSLAMSIVENVALGQGIPVGVASMEMTSTSLAKRMISSQSGVDGHHLLTGNLSKLDFPAMASSAAKIASSKIYLDETPHLTPAQLLAKARSWRLRHKIELLVVDYLQLMRAKSDNRQHEVSLCSASAKQVAKELDIPVIILSQLNRMVEHQDRPPRLSDLKESGSIEQDADVVGLMYKPDSTHNDENPTVRLSIAKHRNGPTGYCDLEFVKEQTRFREYPDN